MDTMLDKDQHVYETNLVPRTAEETLDCNAKSDMQGTNMSLSQRAAILRSKIVTSEADGRVHKTRASSKHQMAACCFCKKRRKKCDGGYPTCGACKLNNTLCTVIDVPTGREVTRNYIESLEDKIEFLKEQLVMSNATKKSVQESRESESCSSENEDGGKESALPIEVGYITLAAAGEPRYIGASSAYSIARAIHSTINYYQQQKSDSNINDLANVGDSQLVPELQITEATFSKPAINESRQLLKAYHYGVQFQYPFLDWQWVTESFDKVMKENSEADEPLFFTYMIFAIGSQLLEHSAGSYSAQNTRAYYDKAFNHITPVVEGTSIRAVQAYLLLSVFSQKMPYGSSIWQTTGLALRHSVALGLHRKPYNGRMNGSRHEVESVRDLKCRIFWCAYSMERINGLVLGRPFGIADVDIDVPLPQSDEYTAATHVFKLRMLQSSICSFVYKPQFYSGSLEDTQATRHQIMLKLNEWKMTFPYKMDAKTTWETKNWCTISYHNSVLLLLRPVILEVAELKKKTSPTTAEWFTVFAQSASAICLNYKQLHAKQKLSYTWLAIQCVFVAGVSFLYCIWLDSSLNFLKWIRKSTIYDTVSACSNILYVLAERWEGAKMFRNSFERLSKAVLTHVESSVDEQMTGNALAVVPQDSTMGFTREMKTMMHQNYQESLNYEIEFTPLPDHREQSATDGLSFTIPPSESGNSSPVVPNMASPRAIDVDTDCNSIWDFLSSTADNFIKDMFCDLEKAFDK
ncbi:LANO_0F12420g1_1 [Lachancea nothofagi CBS 11611]|uniref:LANO_0F12420g1_1 n=1 Tax=Lachancea nothofagi CBS 11611 TaxID=1266666 RepID=A0A1G4KBA5_9SACH|nr:LANO_0F12420g1_1 [Lachancea nothofagi CBS 11611]